MPKLADFARYVLSLRGLSTAGFSGESIRGVTGTRDDRVRQHGAHPLAPKSCAPGKPGSMGKEVSGDPLKFEIGTQQVRILPSQRLASRLEASLAWRWGDPRHEA